MNTLKKYTPFTRLFLASGILLIIYGFIARIAPVYFFWESRTVGWTFLLIGLIGVMSEEIKPRSIKKKPTFPNKIGIGLICFLLIIQLALLITIYNSAAFQVAKEFITKESEVQFELGKISGFSLTPTGSISVSGKKGLESGMAEINMIIKGEEGFKSATIYVYKENGGKWEVVDMEYNRIW